MGHRTMHGAEQGQGGLTQTPAFFSGGWSLPDCLDMMFTQHVQPCSTSNFKQELCLGSDQNWGWQSKIGTDDGLMCSKNVF